MKKITFLTILFLSTIYILKGQNNYFEILNNDTVKYYFSITGEPTNSDYTFYRIGKLNKFMLGFEGKVVDYNEWDRKLFEGNYINGALNGPFILYHKNGKIKIQGNYKDNNRNGIWKFYHENGNIEMILEYGEKVKLIEYNKFSGKNLVKDGNGVFKWNSESVLGIKLTGEVKDGLRVGKWKHSKYTEYYDSDGNFIKGEQEYEPKEYYDGSKFMYSVPFDHEKAFLFSLNTDVNGINRLNINIYKPLLESEKTLIQQYLSNVLDSIKILNDSEKVRYYWFIFNTKLNEQGEMVINKYISTNTNEYFDKMVKNWVVNCANWDKIGFKDFEGIEYSFYFPIVIFNRNILIP